MYTLCIQNQKAKELYPNIGNESEKVEFIRKDN